MANKNIPLGFSYVQGSDCGRVRRVEVTNGVSLSSGDVTYLDSAGRAYDTAGALSLGVGFSNIIDGYTGEINTTAATASEDYMLIYTGVFNMYIGQIGDGNLEDPYTTNSSADCFDEAGATGVQYINQAASSNDTWKVLGAANEYDSGDKSAYDTYQKVYCQLNSLVDAFGSIA